MENHSQVYVIRQGQVNRILFVKFYLQLSTEGVRGGLVVWLALLAADHRVDSSRPLVTSVVVSPTYQGAAGDALTCYYC